MADRAHMEKRQAAILVEALDAHPQRSLRHEITKPGDPLALRGVPLVGAAAGAIWETAPHVEAIRRIARAERLREQTEC